MAGMFHVTFHASDGSRSPFTAETVIAADASDAIKKATKKVGKKIMKLEGGLFPSEVKLLGFES